MKLEIVTNVMVYHPSLTAVLSGSPSFVILLSVNIAKVRLSDRVIMLRVP